MQSLAKQNAFVFMPLISTGPKYQIMGPTTKLRIAGIDWSDGVYSDYLILVTPIELEIRGVAVGVDYVKKASSRHKYGKILNQKFVFSPNTYFYLTKETPIS